MVTGWRRAFCTSIHREREPKVVTEKQQQQHCDNNNNSSTNNQSPKISSKFGFFSNPSTPRFQSQPVASGPGLRCRTSISTGATTCSVPNSPKLQCSNPKTTKKQTTLSPRLFQLSNPSSPKSPSSFSLFKSTLRLSKSRCGICMQSVKSGQGTAIFTAECSHSFHFPCIATQAKKNPILTCPVCSTCWKELPVLAIHEDNKHNNKTTSEATNRDAAATTKTRSLKVYNDDEPLMSPTSVARFNPIPESENEDEQEDESNEFQGFNVSPFVSFSPEERIRGLEMSLLPEAAIVAANRSYETYAVVLKLKAPAAPLHKATRRSPVDLVAVLDVGGAMSGAKLRLMKSSMRFVISSLSSADRLSIVAFSAGSKRLFPLRRMTAGGQRSARRIIDALAVIDQSRDGAPVMNDALKKAVKVLEDRREKNSVASIVVLSDSNYSRSVAYSQKSWLISSTRLPQLDVPVHAIRFPGERECNHALNDDAFAKTVRSLLQVVAQDVRIQLAVVSRPRPVEIAAVYSLTSRPESLVPGSTRIGDLYAEEERELLLEIKVPAASAGSHHVLTVRSSYRDPLTQEIASPVEHAMLVPRPNTVRSSCPKIERLRNLHVTARAVAESSRLVEHGDFSGAYHLLSSARALLLRSCKPAVEHVRWLEAEQAELNRRLQSQKVKTSKVEEKVEPLTPTSAWRAAERLAKVAIMRKSMNRVSDLHGFENARF
ncbi:E3 ubiquitin-protein ligase WAVH1-like [Arachis stenosperma]|uniref:E3 ubiquitin-protein ligase WAVH1-like n=1 Tax=Arachis stenosperma TaxID=217475 RepID=UPI0025ABC807|nr:E3 ubiquitin-protein ligase WAVH1-like [Arachis stenosperma]